MKRSNRSATQKDIAKIVGVSVQTVSRAINKTGYVEAKLLERIERVAKAINYTPNQLARALVKGYSKSIGVFVDGSAGYGPSAIVGSIESLARKHNFTVTVSVLGVNYETNRDKDETANNVKAIFENFSRIGVEAIICVQNNDDTNKVIDGLRMSVPVIFAIDNDIDGNAKLSMTRSSWYCIRINQQEGVEQIFDYLNECGHKNVLHIAGPLWSFDAQSRHNHAIKYAQKCGIKLEVILSDSWSAKDGYQICYKYFKELLDKHDDCQLPTAIFAANDLIALGAQKALTNLNIKIPDEVSIIGFDDFPGVDYAISSLTTIKQPFEELGQVIMQDLYDYFTDNKELDNKTISPQIVIRESVKRM